MAFLRKAANILGNTLNNQINHQVSLSKSSLLQAIQCMSSSKVFVGGVSYTTDDRCLEEAFSKYGEVAEARIIMDREIGRSKGFPFVTFASKESASAIQALDQQKLHGRTVRVSYANDRSRGFGGVGYGGGGSGRNQMRLYHHQVGPPKKVRVNMKERGNRRDQFRRILAAKYEWKRRLSKAFIRDTDLPQEFRERMRMQLSSWPRNSSMTRVKNRCVVTGRSRAVYRFCRVSRIVFRGLAVRGNMMGIKKASW